MPILTLDGADGAAPPPAAEVTLSYPDRRTGGTFRRCMWLFMVLSKWLTI